MVLNKIDLINRPELLNIAKSLNQKLQFKSTFMISAKKNEGVEVLLKEILSLIPNKKWLYTNISTKTDKDINFQISEITRKIFQLINKEIHIQLK